MSVESWYASKVKYPKHQNDQQCKIKQGSCDQSVLMVSINNGSTTAFEETSKLIINIL